MALDYLASMKRVFRTKNTINLKGTGSYTIIPAQARRILVTRVMVVPQTFAGTPGVTPQMTFGTNDPDYTNVYGDDGSTLNLPNTTLVNFVYAIDMVYTDHQQYLQYADLTSNGLRVKVTVASTNSGVHTAHVFVEGAIF